MPRNVHDFSASFPDFVIITKWCNIIRPLRQSDYLLLNKDKNKDNFLDKNCIFLEIKTIKQKED